MLSFIYKAGINNPAYLIHLVWELNEILIYVKRLAQCLAHGEPSNGVNYQVFFKPLINLDFQPQNLEKTSPTSISSEQVKCLSSFCQRSADQSGKEYGFETIKKVRLKSLDLESLAYFPPEQPFLGSYSRMLFKCEPRKRLAWDPGKSGSVHCSERLWRWLADYCGTSPEGNQEGGPQEKA